MRSKQLGPPGAGQNAGKQKTSLNKITNKLRNAINGIPRGERSNLTDALRFALGNAKCTSEINSLPNSDKGKLVIFIQTTCDSLSGARIPDVTPENVIDALISLHCDLGKSEILPLIDQPPTPARPAPTAVARPASSAAKPVVSTSSLSSVSLSSTSIRRFLAGEEIKIMDFYNLPVNEWQVLKGKQVLVHGEVLVICDISFDSIHYYERVFDLQHSNGCSSFAFEDTSIQYIPDIQMTEKEIKIMNDLKDGSEVTLPKNPSRAFIKMWNEDIVCALATVTEQTIRGQKNEERYEFVHLDSFGIEGKVLKLGLIKRGEVHKFTQLFPGDSTIIVKPTCGRKHTNFTPISGSTVDRVLK